MVSLYLLDGELVAGARHLATQFILAVLGYAHEKDLIGLYVLISGDRVGEVPFGIVVALVDLRIDGDAHVQAFHVHFDAVTHQLSHRCPILVLDDFLLLAVAARPQPATIHLVESGGACVCQRIRWNRCH